METTIPAALRGKSAQLVLLKVPAGESIPGKAVGSFLYLYESPIEVEWRMDGQPFVPAKAGAQLECTEGKYFEWFEVRNPSTVDVFVKVYAGWVKFADQRPYPLEPLTEFRGITLTLPALSATPIPARTAANIIRRKLVRITNGGGTGGGAVQIRNEANEYGEFVFPWVPAQIETADSLFVENLNAYAVEVGITEIYWVTRPTVFAPPISS